MVTILLFLLVGCGNSNSSVIEETTEAVVDTTVEPTTEKPTEPPTTEPPQLSKSCDMVLASGYDGDDYYQLVANETEDYNGVKDELGVIKNNEWLLKPTLDMPFVNDDGSMKGVKKYIVLIIEIFFTLEIVVFTIILQHQEDMHLTYIKIFFLMLKLTSIMNKILHLVLQISIMAQ